MEITSIKYISASPYVTKAQIMKSLDISARTVSNRLASMCNVEDTGTTQSWTAAA